MAAINRDPLTAPHRTRNDALLAVGVAVLATAIALLGDKGPLPDALGWALLLTAHVPLVWRRRHPVLVLLAALVCVAPYHALDNNHAAPIPATMLVLYTVAATGTARRTLLTGAAVLGVTLIINALTNPDGVLEVLRISGWVIAVLFCGIDVRYYRQYVASIVERAVRAERTREEEARRRVAEERLRIARDLHDLLAHSITLIGVQTSVAAHVLAADPDRLDREAVAKALDDIADTCRGARGELRTTLEVLRASEHGDGRGPLPGLDGVAHLVEAARLAGARVESSVRVDHAPPAVGAAAYRIVQESLTNSVRHGGPGLTIRVDLYEKDGSLRVSVTDDGTGQASASDGTPGFGLVGMRERARSVGGTLDAGPRSGGGFEVSAVLPVQPVASVPVPPMLPVPAEPVGTAEPVTTPEPVEPSAHREEAR
ncbi:sensor histidine kinase [Streptomyces sporangiiformans]|uniref:histidine kinase n=1 Tax=Streptomyces sporangiiformans TaxID=2315329 RepID=A0A505D164_9ACTN|nr:histidine kinase [Streptomyces sporangiiformans]TPQ15892.1 sensor histidine kinase [Streptomyces sporangiiformans]